MDIYGTLSLNEMQQMIATKTGDYTLIGETKSVRGEVSLTGGGIR